MYIMSLCSLCILLAVITPAYSSYIFGAVKANDDAPFETYILAWYFRILWDHETKLSGITFFISYF